MLTYSGSIFHERTDDHVFATYFVASELQKTGESCDEIPSGRFRWISLGTFQPNSESFLLCFSTFSIYAVIF